MSRPRAGAAGTVKTATIAIEFLGMQRVTTRKDRIHMPVTETTPAADALAFVREKFPELALRPEGLIVTVNHSVVPIDTPLKAGDVVCFVPPIGGG